MADPPRPAVGPAIASAAAHSPAAASPAADGDQRYRLRSVERALDALELLAAAGQGGLTLTELAERLAVAKSSAFALLHTLAARGYAAESGGRLDRTYRLGMALAKLGDAAERQSPLIVLAMPVLQSITDGTGLTARLVVPDGPYAVAVARVDAPGTVRFASYLGAREYPHCTSAGKALLAALPQDRARALAVEAGPAVAHAADDHRPGRAHPRPGGERRPRLRDRRRRGLRGRVLRGRRGLRPDRRVRRRAQRHRPEAQPPDLASRRTRGRRPRRRGPANASPRRNALRRPRPARQQQRRSPWLTTARSSSPSRASSRCTTWPRSSRAPAR